MHLNQFLVKYRASGFHLLINLDKFSVPGLNVKFKRNIVPVHGLVEVTGQELFLVSSETDLGPHILTVTVTDEYDTRTQLYHKARTSALNESVSFRVEENRVVEQVDIRRIDVVANYTGHRQHPTANTYFYVLRMGEDR